MYKPPTAEMIAYLDFSVSTTGMLTGVKVRPIIATIKHWCECSIWYPRAILTTICKSVLSLAIQKAVTFHLTSKRTNILVMDWKINCREKSIHNPHCFKVSAFRLVSDISRRCQCTVSLYKAAVWTLLFSPNSHLPGSILWSGFCFVVPRKVNHSKRSTVVLHITLSVSAVWFLIYLSQLFVLLALFLQRLLRSPVHPDSSLRVGELLASVAQHAQSVPHQRHLLLLLRHGALH